MQDSEFTAFIEKNLKKMLKINLSLISVLLVILLFVSCRGKQQNSPTSGVTYIAVDETFAPIIQNEINVFESIYISAGIIDTVCSEIDAFNLLFKDSVRMIIATRTLTKEEKEYFNSKTIFPK